MAGVPVIEPARIGAALARLRDRLLLDDVDQSVVIRWDVVTGWTTEHFQLAAVDGRWVVSDGVPDASRLAIRVGVDDLLGLAAGHLGGGEAFFSGRLHLSGDLVLAQTILPGFGEHADQAVTPPRPDRPAP
jgi:predicted lipid carrier protein YhbT